MSPTPKAQSDTDRHIDLGAAVDPRDFWPMLMPPWEAPVGWRTNGFGVPQEYRILGRCEGLVVYAWESTTGATNRSINERWHVSSCDPSTIFTTREEAALYGLADVQKSLAKLAEALQQITADQIAKKK